MLFGVRLDRMQNVDYMDVKLWISLPVLTMFFAVLIRKLWDVLGQSLVKREKETLTERLCGLYRSGKVRRILFLLL